MRTTLDIDDDVLEAARNLSRREGLSLGAAVSDLARRSLAPATIEYKNGRPVFRSPPGARPITLKMVRDALADEGFD